jgi:2-C-methyl-D-erythritol 2,4-cyclodiphosphate synthase
MRSAESVISRSVRTLDGVIVPLVGVGTDVHAYEPGRPEWAGAAGVTLLAETARRVRAAGFAVGNVSVQAIGRAPKVGSRRAEAEKVLGEAVGAPVRLSGTTTDGLGFTGRGEGLAAVAVALIYPADQPEERPAQVQA